MQKYLDVRLEYGMTLSQCREQKKLQVVQHARWGGDLEIRLLAFAIEL